MHKIIGKPPFSPVLFYSGKIAGYTTWIALALYMLGVRVNHYENPHFINALGYFIAGFGLTISVASLFSLGNSISLGIPDEKTELKTQGLYKLTRNPMYVGFNLLTISAALLTANYWVSLLALFSLIIYHFIILGEEAFLRERFGDKYEAYCKNTRRYL